jgi:hypothetical protein
MWFEGALNRIAGLAANQVRERQTAPSRAEYRVALGELLKAMTTVERLSQGSILLDAMLRFELFHNNELTRITATLRQWHTQLAGGGQDDVLDRLGQPSPKLLISVGVIGLCQQVGIELPNWKNTRLIALCATMLSWAQTQADDPAPADLRETQWKGPLLQARAVYETADYDLSAELDQRTIHARGMIDGLMALMQHPDAAFVRVYLGPKHPDSPPDLIVTRR